MKISKLVASLMLSTTLLSVATPVLADQIDQSSETTKSEKTNSSANAVVASAKESSSTAESSNEPIQELKEQKMIIKKIIAKGGSQIATVTENNSNAEKSPGIAQSDYKGVPNSKFVVYDVTELMETLIKEKLGVDDQKAQQALEIASSEEEQDNKEEAMSDTQKAESELKSDTSKVSSSTEATRKVSEESGKNTSEDNLKRDKTAEVDRELVEKVKDLRQGDTLRKTISERAAKLSKDQLKAVTEVTTDDQGQAEVMLPIDGKYHAYYVVNTETDKESYATNSSPIVVITPVTDTDGKYATDFTIYPKSDTVEKDQPTQETPQKETTATMYQTGHKSDSIFAKFKEWIVNLF